MSKDKNNKEVTEKSNFGGFTVIKTGFEELTPEPVATIDDVKTGAEDGIVIEENPVIEEPIIEETIIEPIAEEEEEIEPSAFRSFIKELYNKGVVDFDDTIEDFEESEQGIAKVVDKTLEHRINKWQEQLNPDYVKFLEFTQNGGNPKQFLEIYYGNQSWEDFKIDSEENQKAVVAESLRLAGESEEDIQDIVTEWYDNGTLEKRAKPAIAKLQKYEASQKEEIVKSQEIKAKKQADEQKEYHSPYLSILKTTYRDNAFLTGEDRRGLENEKDKYYYDVYTLGNWGILGHLIFTNWSVQDLSEMQDQFTNRRNGLDFGFSSDPAALSRSHYDRMRKTIYLFDELYELGLTNDLLAQDLKRICGEDRIICDSAEPKSIKELQNYGVGATSAEKGKDSVIHGIQWLQQQTIIIDAKCVNTKNEFMQYHWKEDKNGVAIREPADKNNHIIDGTRYAYERDMSEEWLIT